MRFENGARGVYEQGPEDKVTFAKYSPVVLTLEHLSVGSKWCEGQGQDHVRED